MSKYDYPFDEWWEKEGRHLFEGQPEGSISPKVYAMAGWNAGAATTIEIFAQRFEKARGEMP